MEKPDYSLFALPLFAVAMGGGAWGFIAWYKDYVHWQYGLPAEGGLEQVVGSGLGMVGLIGLLVLLVLEKRQPKKGEPKKGHR